MIVVGAPRDASIVDRLLGTVATEVVRRADCEVLVVRPRQDDSPPAGDASVPA
jgi:nucleotide-binding universal stress UspA family protein